MQTFLDCLPCFLKQALRTSQIITNDKKIQKQILDEICEVLKNVPLENTPPETALTVYQKITEITKVEDPYKKIKQECTQKALDLYPSLKELVKKSDDKLLTAIKIATAGNVIDFGASSNFNIEKEIDNIFKRGFAIFDYQEFKNKFAETDEILYLGDNAGESVFDRILIEEMRKKVTYVVREKPIINDVIYEDALQAGINNVAKIISPGASTPGTVLKNCNQDFLDIFKKSQLIISKGQGNYEALSEEQYPIFFLLKTKCKIVAKQLNVQNGDMILKKNH